MVFAYEMAVRMFLYIKCKILKVLVFLGENKIVE